MKIATARAAAAGWVMRHVGQAAWFRGAFFCSSTTSLPDDAELPAGSDVDVMVVTAQDEAPSKIGKFVEQGALIEVTYVPWRLLSSPEQVLASYIYAGSFHRSTIIADPTGDLRRLHASAFHALIADLGLTTSDDILRRAEEVTRFLPGLWETAETIISAAPRPTP